MDRARGHDPSVPSVDLRLPLGAPLEGKSSRAFPRVSVALGALVVLAIAVALLPIAASVRTVVALSLLAAAFLLHRRTVRVPRAPRGWVTVDASGVVRVDGSGSLRIVDWAEPFGVTVLANHDRSRVLVAFTTAAQTRYLTVSVSGIGDAELARTLLGRAATIADSDVHDARSRDDASLGAGDGEQLLLAVAAHAKGALERIYLTDAHGGPIVLDGMKLRLGKQTIDLSSPLEWRGFMFQESGGRVSSLYQATWIRQADAEAVLVAPLPPESSWMKDLRESARETGARDPLAQRGVVRDLYLAQSLPDDAPPRGLRLAVDRLFMLPLRQALDRAPRISRIGTDGTFAQKLSNATSSREFPHGER